MGQTADPARRPERHRRRHRADQHRRRHDHRLAAARRRLVALLCRPPLPAAARHRRHRHRHRAPARALAGAALRPRGRPRTTARTASIEFAAALTLPAAVALLVIPGPIITVLFEHGAFAAADTAATAPALAAYAAGLPAFVAIKVFQPGFFAREDTATPMWYGGGLDGGQRRRRLRALLFLRAMSASRPQPRSPPGSIPALLAGHAGAARPFRPRRGAEAPAAAARARLAAHGHRASTHRRWAGAVDRRSRLSSRSS